MDAYVSGIRFNGEGGCGKKHVSNLKSMDDIEI